MSIESRFGYGKGYVKGYQSSNFDMSDASNRATIAIMKLFPKLDVHELCWCEECAPKRHEEEAHFDTIKTAIEEAMEIAWKEGRNFDQSTD